MAPTLPNTINGDKRPVSSRPPPGERRSELVCRVKYCNTLPDIPFDPKFITYPFEATRFIQYKPTSLERNYKYEVLTEHDLGVMIDLINREQYTPDPRAILDKADENLLEEDILTPHDSRRSRHHGRSVSWLRRTEYISTEQTRFQPPVMDKIEAKVGYSIKKSLKEETLYMDRESQIKAIDKTFDDVTKPIERHYSKQSVTPVEILPIFPDFKMWKYPCAQVMFDSDPAPVGRPFPAQLEEMSQAMIRGVMDESGEQFVAYFLPTEETLEKRRRDFTDCVDYVDDEEYDYKIAREYNWNVKTKATKGYEENYFLVVRQDGVYFNELETRVRLTKRRQKVGQQPNNTRLVVKHRPMDAAEFSVHRGREKQLEPPIEEEEEEEEEEDEEEEQKAKDKEGDSDSDKENRADGVRKESAKSDSSGNESDTSAKSAASGSSSASSKSAASVKSATSAKSVASAKSAASDSSDGSRRSTASGKSSASNKSANSNASGKSNKSQASHKSGSSSKSSKSNQSVKSGKSDASARSSKSKASERSGSASKESAASGSDQSDAERSNDSSPRGNKDQGSRSGSASSSGSASDSD